MDLFTIAIIIVGIVFVYFMIRNNKKKVEQHTEVMIPIDKENYNYQYRQQQEQIKALKQNLELKKQQDEIQRLNSRLKQPIFIKPVMINQPKRKQTNMFNIKEDDDGGLKNYFKNW